MLQDFRTALRVISRDRWLTAAAVTALALGIGVNATVFTLVNAVLIKGLPFPESHNLYFLGIRNMTQPGTSSGSVSQRELDHWREQSRAFTSMGGFSGLSINLADDLQMPEQQQGARLTTDVFRILRVQPVLGRDFRPEDGQPGAARAVILGDGLWKRRYGGDPAVLGRTIRINGEPASIIGVMPPDMKFPTNAELWIQISPPSTPAEQSSRSMAVVARLREGVTPRQAQADLDAIGARLASEYPDTNKDMGIVMQTANERFNGGEIRVLFLAMLGAVGFVLLIACANVANLQLSRSMQRTREIAVRVALGATRRRIVRQLLVESVLIASIGGLFGLLIAFGLFALIALTLSAVGLYAVMAYSVTQRTQEIGMRMALGARGAQVSWLVLRRGLWQLAIGLVLGLAGAYGAAQVLESVLVPGTAAREPLLFVSIAAVLITVALTACLVPARRAARVDPLVALRE